MTDLDQHLSLLESSGLVRLAQLEPELEYLFKHALLQDTVYGNMVRYERQNMHRAVGEALERLYPDRREELAATLAHHFAEGGDEARALGYFTQAGDAAAARYAMGEAIAHFSRAIEIARPGASADQLQHLYAARGRACEIAQRYTDALANYEDMNRVARERGFQPMELVALTSQATLLSTPTVVQDSSRSREALEQARALAHELGDATAEARILWTLMLNVLYTGGDPHEGVGYGEQSLELARRYDLREQIAFTQHDLIRMYSAALDHEAALHAFEEAARLWRELDNLPMLADSHSAAAAIDMYDGNLGRAQATAQEGYRIAAQSGDLWSQASNGWISGRVAFELGRIGDAIHDLEVSVRVSDDIGHPIVMYTRCDLALIVAFAGDSERAIALCEEAIAAIGRSPIPLVERIKPWPHSVLARLNAARGRMAEAEQGVALCLALDTSDIPGLLPVSVPFGLARADTALAGGHLDQAIALCDDLAAHLVSDHLRIWLPETLLIKGRALLAGENLDAAADMLGEARRAAEGNGSKRMLWAVLGTLADVETRRGDPALGDALSGAARRIASEIAATIDDQAIRDRFLSVVR